VYETEGPRLVRCADLAGCPAVRHRRPPAGAGYPREPPASRRLPRPGVASGWCPFPTV